MSDRVHRIGVVGIDGCGKSSFISALRESVATDTDFVSITCPDFHATPNAPLQQLSRRLKAFSDGADVIGQPVVKASALYLQMTLYGPVERFFLQTYRPEVLVCERHPIVETLVYGPLYAQLGQGQSATASDLQAIRELLDGQEPGMMDTVLAWYRRHSSQLDLSGGLWDILPGVVSLVGQELTAAIAGFGARYQTELPDDVLWLDVPPELATRRCADRVNGGQLEAHETPERLAFLRDRYLVVGDLLAQHAPQTRFHVVKAEDRSPEALVAASLECVALA